MKNEKNVFQDNTRPPSVQAPVAVFKSKEGDSLIHLLPGNARIEMPLNYYKKILDMPFEPAEKRTNPIRSKIYGFTARPDIFLNQKGDYLIHRVPGFQVAKHINYYKKILAHEVSESSNDLPQKARA